MGLVLSSGVLKTSDIIFVRGRKHTLHRQTGPPTDLQLSGCNLLMLNDRRQGNILKELAQTLKICSKIITYQVRKVLEGFERQATKEQVEEFLHASLIYTAKKSGCNIMFLNAWKHAYVRACLCRYSVASLYGDDGTTQIPFDTQ